MRISDWSSDVCSSDLGGGPIPGEPTDPDAPPALPGGRSIAAACPPGTAGAHFADPPGGHAHAAPVRCMPAWQLAQGFPDGTSGPGLPVTLSLLASIISRRIVAAAAGLSSAEPR